MHSKLVAMEGKHEMLAIGLTVAVYNLVHGVFALSSLYESRSSCPGASISSNDVFGADKEKSFCN